VIDWLCGWLGLGLGLGVRADGWVID